MEELEHGTTIHSAEFDASIWIGMIYGRRLRGAGDVSRLQGWQPRSPRADRCGDPALPKNAAINERRASCAGRRARHRLWCGHDSPPPRVSAGAAGPTYAARDRHPAAIECRLTALLGTAIRWLDAAAALQLPAVALAVLVSAPTARGDGGLMRLSQAAGPFEITLFTAPTPLRAGRVDVSVLVQADRAPVLDAEVQVALRAPGLERTAAATRAAATNKLLYAALLDVPEPGRWTLEARVRAGERAATVSCEVDVAPPLPPLLAFWPYVAFPAVAIALFALHQWLTRRPRAWR